MSTSQQPSIEAIQAIINDELFWASQRMMARVQALFPAAGGANAMTAQNLDTEAEDHRMGTPSRTPRLQEATAVDGPYQDEHIARAQEAETLLTTGIDHETTPDVIQMEDAALHDALSTVDREEQQSSAGRSTRETSLLLRPASPYAMDGISPPYHVPSSSDSQDSETRAERTQVRESETPPRLRINPPSPVPEHESRRVRTPTGPRYPYVVQSSPFSQRRGRQVSREHRHDPLSQASRSSDRRRHASNPSPSRYHSSDTYRPDPTTQRPRRPRRPASTIRRPRRLSPPAHSHRSQAFLTREPRSPQTREPRRPASTIRRSHRPAPLAFHPQRPSPPDRDPRRPFRRDGDQSYGSIPTFGVDSAARASPRNFGSTAVSPSQESPRSYMLPTNSSAAKETHKSRHPAHSNNPKGKEKAKTPPKTTSTTARKSASPKEASNDFPSESADSVARRQLGDLEEGEIDDDGGQAEDRAWHEQKLEEWRERRDKPFERDPWEDWTTKKDP